MIRAQEIIRMKQLLTELYMKHCSKPADVVGGLFTSIERPSIGIAGYVRDR